MSVCLLGVTVTDPEVGDVIHSADDQQEPTSTGRDQQTQEDESAARAAGLIASHDHLPFVASSRQG